MSLSIEMAHQIVEASKQLARELRSPVSIAVVDAGGHLVLFERMMSPYGWATCGISIAKATTAVMFNQSTDSVAQWGAGIPGFAASLTSMTNGKFIMAAGGWPIRINGMTIGGIGVSGGNAPGRDDEIARAGLAAIQASIPSTPFPSSTPQHSFSGVSSSSGTQHSSQSANSDASPTSETSYLPSFKDQFPAETPKETYNAEKPSESDGKSAGDKS